MPIIREPLEVIILGDYIREWRNVRGGILLTPKSHLHFDRLIIQSQYAISMEKIFSFSCMIDLVPEEGMGEDSRRLYRSFVGLAAELSWRGSIFWPRPLFKSHTLLDRLRDHIPEIRVSTELVDELNRSGPVIKMLRKVRPKSLHIVLSSFLRLPTEPADVEPDPIRRLVDYYHNPVEVSWVISLSKLIMRSIGYKKSFINIIRLLDLISQVIVDVSHGVSTKLIKPDLVEAIFKRWLTKTVSKS